MKRAVYVEKPRPASNVGGMALPGGVIIMSPKRAAAAVRGRKGSVDVSILNPPISQNGRLSGIPVVRGLVKVASAVSFELRNASVFVSSARGIPAAEVLPELLKNHGAEHKAVHCYERGLPMTVENAMKQERFHPRCGSSLAANSLLAYGLLWVLLPKKASLKAGGTLDTLLTVLSYGIGYETCRYASIHNNSLSRLVSAPGLLFQRVTTMEPEERHVECAVAAVNASVS